MNVFYTRHARERMRERRISRKEVEECILHSSGVFMESEKVRRFRKTFDHVTIEVITELKGDHFIVITVYPQ